MTSNVISATQNLTNILGAHQNGKGYFVRPAKATMYKRYFRYLGCLWEAVETVLLTVVPVVVGVVLHLPALDADSIIYCIVDFIFMK